MCCKTSIVIVVWRARSGGNLPQWTDPRLQTAPGQPPRGKTRIGGLAESLGPIQTR